jgi:predicted RNA-binding protein associated with RNAse of E/G family
MTPLVPVLEIKRTLAGVEKHFQCQLLAADGADHAVVLWVAREPMHVHGVDLPAGTVSLGHFWTDRHYNVYHWVDGNRRTIGFYFNVADQTEIRADPACIQWRDLVIDVLATPEGRLDVLDEDELPAALDPETAAHIEAGRRAILTSPAALLAEIEAASRPLLPLIQL